MPPSLPEPWLSKRRSPWRAAWAAPDPWDPVSPQLYQELKFRVVLVGLDIWNYGDKIQVSSDPSITLDNFLTWRAQNLVGRHPHDNVQLIT